MPIQGDICGTWDPSKDVRFQFQAGGAKLSGPYDMAELYVTYAHKRILYCVVDWCPIIVVSHSIILIRTQLFLNLTLAVDWGSTSVYVHILCYLIKRSGISDGIWLGNTLHNIYDVYIHNVIDRYMLLYSNTNTIWIQLIV